LNLDYYKLIFQIFLKFYFETKFVYLYAQKNITCSLMFNEFLLQFKKYIEIYVYKDP
jgi:hypothetical protein